MHENAVTVDITRPDSNKPDIIKLNVVCVLKSPDNPHLRYDPSWVQKLQRGVARNLTIPHSFTCLSDIPIPDVHVEPLRHNWMQYWSKIEMFRPGLFSGPTLYFDID